MIQYVVEYKKSKHAAIFPSLDAMAKAQLSNMYERRRVDLQKRWSTTVLPSLKVKYRWLIINYAYFQALLVDLSNV